MQNINPNNLPTIISSALEACFERDALNKSMFTLLYFTLRSKTCCEM